jgi:hypothetical protein
MLEGLLVLTGQLMIGWSTRLLAYLITKYYEARPVPTVTPDRHAGRPERRCTTRATRLRISCPAKRARRRGTIGGWAKPIAWITSGSYGTNSWAAFGQPSSCVGALLGICPAFQAAGHGRGM